MRHPFYLVADFPLMAHDPIEPPEPHRQEEPRFGDVLPCKPLAAFQLGRACRILRLEFDLVRDPPDWSGSVVVGGRDPCLTINLLREACVSLKGELEAQSARGLDSLLNEFYAYATDLIRGWLMGESPVFQSATSGVVGDRRWERLYDLADRALPAHHPLKSILNFGAAIGDYERALQVSQPGPERSGGFGALPDIRPLVLRLRELPIVMIRANHLFDAMVRLAPDLESHGQATYLRILRNWIREAGLTPLTDGAPDPWDRLLRNRVTRLATMDLDDDDFVLLMIEIATELTCLYLNDVSQNSLLAGHLKPSWNPTTREILYGGEVVRIVAWQAHNLRKILDAFQNQGWPSRIEDPMRQANGFRSGSLHENLIRLNRGLTKIRFRSAEGGKYIAWVVIKP